MKDIIGNRKKYYKEYIKENEFTEVLKVAASESSFVSVILIGSNIITYDVENDNIRYMGEVESIEELNKLFPLRNVEDRIKEAKIKEATRFALNYGTIDGAHHKMWTIDQIVRILNLDKYNEIIKEIEEEYGWDEGIAP